jgi:hypothetical protein
MLADKIGRPHDLQVGIAEMLLTAHPYTSCDSCLALACHAGVEAARHAALQLARGFLFNRKFGVGCACGHAVELTCRR